MSIQNQSAPTIESHRMYRIGFFWPIVLIGLGVVLLLNNISVLPGNAWEWILRLWPGVLIAWGLDGLLRRQFVGATLMLGLGVIFMAANFGCLNVNIWEFIFRLWPLFLISAGLSLIFERRWLHGVGSVIGAFVILAILVASVALVSGGTQLISWQFGQMLPSQQINQPLNGAKSANIRIEPATGVLNVAALAESSALVDGTINVQGNEQLVQHGQVDGTTANYVLRSDGTYVGFGPSGNQWHNWNLRLAPDLPMILGVKMAAGEANLDISGLQVSDLNVDFAVGSANITLPRDGQMTGKLSNAIGSISLFVPPGTALKITYHGALSSIDVPAGFIHNGSTYTSPNYENATRKSEFTVNEAIGTLTVHEQTGR